ncbi:MAG: hypothetical protein LC800_13860 [Acidobacteria bacterium]|nr:hypothetical protein [Acidobacteriota bacterium]
MRRETKRTGMLACAVAFTLAILFGVAHVTTPTKAEGGVNFILESAIRVDPGAETVTLPLFQGTFAGSPVYYIVTESSDKDDAERRKVNFAPKLRNALGTRAVQRVTKVGGVVNFAGTVRFNSSRPLRAGPDGIPPGTTPPGSVGDENYSPLITSDNRIVLNASQVSNSTGVHDSLVSIDFTRIPTHVQGAVGEVTLSGFLGHWNTAPILYLHMDASSPEVSAVEGSTYAENLDFAPRPGDNDAETSARSAIIPIENGREPRGDPERQGLNSFIQNQGDPLNVTQTFPGSNGDRYSPVWDIHQLRWTEAAIATGQRRRLRSASDVIGEFEKGNLESTGTGPPNPSLKGIRANNAISNCPIVVRLAGVDPGERGPAQENNW